MLMSCVPGCDGKKSQTTGSLDVDKNEVICLECGITLPVSRFAKAGMKSAGDIIRKEKVTKAFQFDCSACNKNVETEVRNSKVSGVGCNKECKFNISKFAIAAMEVGGSGGNGQSLSKGKIKRG